jgi:hypothetical protein
MVNMTNRANIRMRLRAFKLLFSHFIVSFVCGLRIFPYTQGPVKFFARKPELKL